jgi:Zn finger protein HypA/HybF involved in hydrogenase expression
MNEAPEPVKCPNCTYNWWTKSKMKFVTCPNCHVKFDRKKSRKSSNREKIEKKKKK